MGVDLFHDITTLLPNYAPATIFDVGANIGDVALHYAREFKAAEIYCFEPVCGTFQILGSRAKHLPRIHCFNLALGSSATKAKMRVDGNCSGHRILAAEAAPGMETEDVTVDTLDAFCRTYGVSHIGFLKIDTEGFDLEVLMGGVDLLDQRNIDFIQVEAAMNAHNQRHVPLEDFDMYLLPKGYCRFGLYQQTSEFHRIPILRRADVVYISQRLAE